MTDLFRDRLKERLRDPLDKAEAAYKELYHLNGATAPATPLTEDELEEAVRHNEGQLVLTFLGKEPAGVPAAAGPRFEALHRSIRKRVDRSGLELFTRGTHKLRRRFKSDPLATAWETFNTVGQIVLIFWPNQVGSVTGEIFAKIKKDVPNFETPEWKSFLRLKQGEAQMKWEAIGATTDEAIATVASRGDQAIDRRGRGDGQLTPGTVLSDEEAVALFKAMAKVVRYCLPKVQGHLQEGVSQYAWLRDRLCKKDAQGQPTETPLSEAEIGDTFTTCDDAVEIVRRLYQLFHECEKLRGYTEPLANYVRFVGEQAQGWQKRWDEWSLANVDAVKDRLDAIAHATTCKRPDGHTGKLRYWICYGPKEGEPDKPREAIGAARRTFARGTTPPPAGGAPSSATPPPAPAAGSEPPAVEVDRVQRFRDVAKELAGAGEDDAGKRFLALAEEAGLRSEYRGRFEGKWRYAKRYLLRPDSRTQATLRLALFGAGILLVPVTGGWSAAAVFGLWLGTNALAKGVSATEGAYDAQRLKGESFGDVARVRLRRTSDLSKEACSHFVSAVKNWGRVGRVRRDRAYPDNLANCADLGAYLWAVHKLHHHGRKAVDYARPILDVCATAHANLEAWAKLFEEVGEPALKAVAAFVAKDAGDHDNSCGTVSKVASARLRVARNLNATTDQARRISDHCYGPPYDGQGKEAKQPRFPIDLKVRGEEAQAEMEHSREVVRLRRRPLPPLPTAAATPGGAAATTPAATTPGIAVSATDAARCQRCTCKAFNAAVAGRDFCKCGHPRSDHG